MKIKQENLDSLKQLDRIEYRQKERKINEIGKENNAFINLAFLSLGIIFLLMIIIFIQLGNFYTAQKLVIGFFFCITIALIFYLYDFIIHLSSLIIKSKLMRELNEKYFKIEKK